MNNTIPYRPFQLTFEEREQLRNMNNQPPQPPQPPNSQVLVPQPRPGDLLGRAPRGGRPQAPRRRRGAPPGRRHGRH